MVRQLSFLVEYKKSDFGNQIEKFSGNGRIYNILELRGMVL